MQLTQVQTDADGNFVVSADQAPDGASLYLVATGGTPSANKPAGNNSSIALLAVLGAKPPARAVVNEFTTVASVWTHAQFLKGTAILTMILTTGDVFVGMYSATLMREIATMRALGAS